VAFRVFTPILLCIPQVQPAITGLASVPQVSDVDDFDDACFSDVLAAMTLLTDQHKLHKRNLPDMVLKSQLYTIFKDRTASDRELDELRRKGQVRTFKLPTGKQGLDARLLLIRLCLQLLKVFWLNLAAGADEYGLMTAAQYTRLITSMTASQPQSQAPAAGEPLKQSKAKAGPAVGSTPDTKSIAAKQSLDRWGIMPAIGTVAVCAAMLQACKSSCTIRYLYDPHDATP
jgi:hypothetical protein